jgi:hypothetical protein
MNDAATDPQGQFEAARATRDGSFPSTRWSVVFRARSADPAAGAALAELCRVYWRPSKNACIAMKTHQLTSFAPAAAVIVTISTKARRFDSLS